MATKDELVRTCYLLEEQGQDEEVVESEDTELLARTLYSELVKRGHELDSDEV